MRDEPVELPPSSSASIEENDADASGDDYGAIGGDGDVILESDSEGEEGEQVEMSDEEEEAPIYVWDSDDEEESDAGNVDREAEEAEMLAFLRDMKEKASVGDYAPWPSRAFLLCDLITRLPRFRLSRAFQQIIWWWAEELGAHGLPKPKALAKFQKDMLEKDKIGAAPVAHEGVLGNTTYVADVKTLFSQNLSNPQVLKQLHLRPEDTVHNIRGLWQGKKWSRELSAQIVAPMIVAGEKHYYLDEVLRRHVPETEVNPAGSDPNWDNAYFFPRRWIYRDGRIDADGYPVLHHLPTNTFHIQSSDDYLRVRTMDFDMPYSEILESGGGEPPTLYVFDEKGAEIHSETAQLNPERERANGMEIVVVPVSLYGDGCGGIKGSTCRANKEGIVAHFPAGTLENQAEAKDVLVNLLLLYLEGDNPFHNTVSSTPLLSAATFFCRFGFATLPKKCRDPDLIKGFMTLEGCTPRDFQHTAEVAYRVFEKAAAPGGTFNAVTTSMRTEGVKDWLNHTIIEHTLGREKAERQKAAEEEEAADEDEECEEGDADPTATDGPLQELLEAFRAMLADDTDQIEDDEHFFNPLYRLIQSMEFDAHKDTPIEILHTFLLGFFKYLWRHITTEVFKRNGARAKKELGARLSSLSTDGLRCSPLRGPKLVDYAQSLIGRDLKILGQLAIFAIEPFATAEELSMWSSLMHLTSLIWYPLIPDMNIYGDQLDAAVSAFLAATALTDLDWFVKRKFHYPIHLRQSMERIGPALLASTQKQESYNHVFREHSEYSSKRNPGYEIGLAFAHHNRFQHLISGGYYRCPKTRRWRQAGVKALEVFSNNSQVRGLLGMHDTVHATAGMSNGPVLGKRILLPLWHVGALEFRLAPKPQPEWPDIRPACSIISQETLEPCYHNSFVLIQNSVRLSIFFGNQYRTLTLNLQPDAPITIARIKQLGRLISTNATVVRVERFKMLDHCWSLDMPRIQSQHSFYDVNPRSILAPINVQHDCVRLKCELTRRVPEHGAEGQKAAKRRLLISHKEGSEHLVNTGSLRNARLIHTAFPRPPKPIPSLDDVIKEALEHQVPLDIEKSRLASEKARKLRENLEKKANGGVAPKSKGGATTGKKSQAQGKKKGKKAAEDDEETESSDGDAPQVITSRVGRAVKKVVKELPVVVKNPRKKK
ncbi:hypothetical protein P7C70_g6848, partial [Phenoliferia sp. Uapishka_3]